VLETLFTERFFIRPDHSHLAQNNTIGDADGTLSQIRQMHEARLPIALLFGDAQAPYVRLDPDFVGVCHDDPAARRALAAVESAVALNLFDLTLEPGDVLILNNLKAVHGRRPFTAKYDGTDRWLKRVSVTRDLRKSRAHRATAASHLVG
jgi:hypothetical protein